MVPPPAFRFKRDFWCNAALALDASCADAHLALAEEADDPEEALALHERALAAAEAALPPGALEEASGDFEDLAQAGTYLSARTGVSPSCSRPWGRDEEALGHLEEVLRLDPDDTAGVTHPLLAWLMDRGRDGRARDLLETRPCECAQWEYTRALFAYRAGGGEDDEA